ncbi:hypothetical protein QBC40DRAFT_195111 [Triangularia verruculosa]|uniref:Uncharacterized protein n=1 Tax=Triangularia verruculosa TaxID=2587418 RepID=A0AAN6XSE7_9PEZI|nr:hypothetical protein QBC40DRAFT_195111 [Triangularia verruculosa]
MADTNFDKASLEEKCTALSDAATVAFATISLAWTEHDEHPSEQLAMGLPVKLSPARVLAMKLAIFREHAGQLAVCARGADIILPLLGLELDKAVEQAQRAFAALMPDNEGDSSVVGFLSSLSRLFVFGTQLLTMNDEQEQKVKLKSEDGRAIFEAANTASRVLINETRPN